MPEPQVSKKLAYYYKNGHLYAVTSNGAAIEIDDAMSSTSENPVQNKVITSALALKADQATTYTKTEITELLNAIKTIQIQIVQTLPATGESNIIYLVAHSHGTGDGYDEYIWVSSSSSYEKIGNTDIDLSDYPTTTVMNAAIASALSSYYTKSEIDTALGNLEDAVEEVSGKAEKVTIGGLEYTASFTNGTLKFE